MHSIIFFRFIEILNFVSLNRRFQIMSASGYLNARLLSITTKQSVSLILNKLVGLGPKLFCIYFFSGDAEQQESFYIV
ncbi:hypothetical protein ATZ36_15860 [Candidatus Endomicrobiellum trichonymphae]|uniref:Uncharacterized protein n=1 Tax=Endomicrobium trichonymphae TaxID=1408204 RepID=A0A1E5IHM5_ENDTX|nr:hypothetical protein ATZ36_06675 [Candidatus Endomicrobium trichonymphae]OEG71274.1 hypothetical protein ATZ36_15860 [Candidatus Endomicrobium trichonymphae]